MHNAFSLKLWIDKPKRNRSVSRWIVNASGIECAHRLRLSCGPPFWDAQQVRDRNAKAYVVLWLLGPTGSHILTRIERIECIRSVMLTNTIHRKNHLFVEWWCGHFYFIIQFDWLWPLRKWFHPFRRNLSIGAIELSLSCHIEAHEIPAVLCCGGRAWNRCLVNTTMSHAYKKKKKWITNWIGIWNAANAHVHATMGGPGGGKTSARSDGNCKTRHQHRAGATTIRAIGIIIFCHVAWRSNCAERQSKKMYIQTWQGCFISSSTVVFLFFVSG